jgi:putative nucleotidyltransferase with HDIG domain
MADIPTRAETLDLMHEYTESLSLRKHMYAVEAAMRAYAEKSGADIELWGITGLIHDFDYERWPNDAHSPTDEHPSTGVAILREQGWPEEVLDAVMAHADYTHVPATTPLAKTLRAVDELAGFIMACALIRPTRISDLGAKSVKKKLKDKRFAAGVNREDIREAQEALGEDLTEHIDFVVEAMRGIADQLGLQGHA